MLSLVQGATTDGFIQQKAFVHEMHEKHEHMPMYITVNLKTDFSSASILAKSLTLAIIDADKSFSMNQLRHLPDEPLVS